MDGTNNNNNDNDDGTTCTNRTNINVAVRRRKGKYFWPEGHRVGLPYILEVSNFEGLVANANEEVEQDRILYHQLKIAAH